MIRSWALYPSGGVVVPFASSLLDTALWSSESTWAVPSSSTPGLMPNVLPPPRVPALSNSAPTEMVPAVVDVAGMNFEAMPQASAPLVLRSEESIPPVKLPEASTWPLRQIWSTGGRVEGGSARRVGSIWLGETSRGRDALAGRLEKSAVVIRARTAMTITQRRRAMQCLLIVGRAAVGPGPPVRSDSESDRRIAC